MGFCLTDPYIVRSAGSVMPFFTISLAIGTLRDNAFHDPTDLILTTYLTDT